MAELWSNEKKLDVVRMRLEGKTLQFIADKYGCSKQNIQRILQGICGKHNTRIPESIIYPALREWMVENNCTIMDLASNLGIHYQRMYCILRGRNKPSVAVINAILNHTGLKFEEVFGGTTT